MSLWPHEVQQCNGYYIIGSSGSGSIRDSMRVPSAFYGSGRVGGVVVSRYVKIITSKRDVRVTHAAIIMIIIMLSGLSYLICACVYKVK